MVRTEHSRNPVEDVRTQSADCRPNHHDGRDTDNDPDQRKKRPKFMRENRLQRNAESLCMNRRICGKRTQER